jgi:hypothetical protein
MRSLRLWSAAPARNVETASTPTLNVLRGLVARATTPLLPDDYLKLLNPPATTSPASTSASGCELVGAGIGGPTRSRRSHGATRN